MPKFPRALVVLGVLSATLFAPAAHAGLIANGGFESGDFSGWTLNENLPGSSFVNAAGDGPLYAGAHIAVLGAPYAFDSLRQEVSLDAGKSYRLSFALANIEGGVESVSRITASIGGKSLEVADFRGFDYTVHTLDFVAGGGEVLAFEFRHDDAFWLLDDVSLTALPGQDGELPEPGSLALFGLALAAAAVARRRA